MTGRLRFRSTNLIGVISAALLATAIVGLSARCRGQAPQPIGASDLLRSVPFDRLTLIDKTVLIVEPVSPRPLPKIDPKKERERRRKGIRTASTPFEVGVERDEEAEKAEAAEAEALDNIRIHLLETERNEVRDFRVKRSSIKTIEYFEDMLLQEADRLTRARDFARAFECCLRVKSRNPRWPGLADHVNRILYTEGHQALLAGDGERGLRLLRELLARNRDYPGLINQLSEAYGKRVERAIRLGRFVHGRRVLREMENVIGNHASVRALRALFVARASDRIQQGASKGPAERLDALTVGLRIWPMLPGAEEKYREAFQALPTVDVGVMDIAAPPGPWVRSHADDRIIRMLYLPILATDDQEARQGKRDGQLAASIESTDLGRRMLIALRPGYTWSDGSRPVSAADIAQALIGRSDPHSPSYQARWADLLDRVEVGQGGRVEVRLKHAPLKAGDWFLGPVGPAHAGADGRIVTSARDRLLVTDGAFSCITPDDATLELRVREDRSGDAPLPGIRRIREIRLNKGNTAVTALLRGDVTMIDHVPPAQVATLTGAADIQIGRYNQPAIHVIALDGRTPALRSRALRRGLSYSIERKGLLEETLMKHPVNDIDTPADGPFPKGSFADAVGVKPLGFDILLAKMLVAAARKELGGRPIHLTFEYPAIPECRIIVPKLAEAFRIAGVELDLVEVPESQLEGDLKAGRRFDLAYRILRCDDPIAQAGTMLCPSYDAPPDTDPLTSAASPRILQLLLQLERAGEFPTARGLAIQIDRESRDELPVIPLWQVADHYAWRSRLNGPGETADRLYDRIEQWQIDPWIAHDPWDTPAQPKDKP